MEILALKLHKTGEEKQINKENTSQMASAWAAYEGRRKEKREGWSRKGQSGRQSGPC
jgi:hypothetical protein